MAAPHRIDPPSDDIQQRLRILHLLVEVVGTQSELARLIGVGLPTLNQWLTGKYKPEEWHVVLRVVREVIARRPSEASRLIEFFAETILGTQGRWIPDPGPGEVGDFSEEHGDLALAVARTTSAVRNHDLLAVQAAGREVMREAQQFVIAAKREAA